VKRKKNQNFVTVFSIQFEREIDVFQPSFDDISAICWWIFMQNSVLETS
jgi:hypothetical protein